jgi:N-acetylglucosamine-6-sulfatase
MPRRPGRLRRSATALVGGALLWVGTGASLVPGPDTNPALAGTSHPNIVLILTDDQRWDTLKDKYMPTVKSQLMAKGATFENAFVVNSLCCPSRVTILTGTYSHTNGVWTNISPYGGFPGFKHDGSTVATWLNREGYETSLIGKYLNRYEASQKDGSYIPPGWDNWVVFTTETGDADYYDYKLTVNGTIERHPGFAAADYSTDVLAQHADDFIRATPSDRPVFLYFAPSAPHEPATPAPRHQQLYKGIRPWRPASYNERSIGDKPKYLQSIHRFSQSRRNGIDHTRRRQLASLRGVDDAVGQILTALSDTGRLSNTLVIFASDNGYSWGEHRWVGKLVPYEESIRIPLVMRWDAEIDAGVTDARMALNLDLARTIANAAGVDAPGAEGRNLISMLGDRSAPGRERFLIEHLRSKAPPPSYCAVRTERYTYVQYAGGERELYNLRSDPHQLVNVVGKPVNHETVVALKRAARNLCKPRPPGMARF